jgi:hypothetical protein
MTEERKHAILFAATLLSARKIIEVIENHDPMNMGRTFWMDKFVNKAIEQAAQIMEKIDERWPAEAVCGWESLPNRAPQTRPRVPMLCIGQSLTPRRESAHSSNPVHGS